jgi:hypothetical protein
VKWQEVVAEIGTIVCRSRADAGCSTASMAALAAE